jgi:hypothetical protein
VGGFGDERQETKLTHLSVVILILPDSYQRAQKTFHTPMTPREVPAVAETSVKVFAQFESRHKYNAIA